MNSFRNRLLALIIGLVVATQSVTLVAVLWSTAHQVQLRADEELRSGAQVVQQFMRLRADQLASTVSVLAKDFSWGDVLADRKDTATMLSAATNHSKRVGADLVLLMDADGKLLTSNSAYVLTHTATVERLINSMTSERGDVHLVVLGEQLYQLVVAPIKAPDTIAWIAMGFAVDDPLVAHIRDLVGDQVSVLAGEGSQLNLMASTLPPAERAKPALVKVERVKREHGKHTASAAPADAPTPVTAPEAPEPTATLTPPPAEPTTPTRPQPAPTAGITLRAWQGFCFPSLDERPAALRPIYEGVSAGAHQIYCTLPGRGRVLVGAFELRASTHPDIIIVRGADGAPVLGRPQ